MLEIKKIGEEGGLVGVFGEGHLLALGINETVALSNAIEFYPEEVMQCIIANSNHKYHKEKKQNSCSKN